ncbi:MAG: ribose-phosphate diphosphokinase [Myxococcales bacterium]|jgi:ribose-phosphate pyrophosphokinase
MKNDKPLVFGTSSYSDMQRQIAALAGFDLGEVERKQFPDGEHYQRILSDVDGRDAVVVGGTISETETLELYDLACGLVQEDVRSLTLVIPFFGYATMERVSKPGEIVTAKTRARLLSSIPVPATGSRVVLLDLHSEGVPFYFEGAIRPVHLRGTPIVMRAAQRIAGPSFVLAATDAGRAKWVERMALDAGVTASFVFKRRHEDGTTEVTAVSAHVQGANVVIYDDMIRTGGSLINAAHAYRAAGAASISAVATHGVLPGDALGRLQRTALFEHIVCTDSHPRALELRSNLLEIESVAGLFADYLKSEL